MPKKLYFVDSIFTHGEENNAEITLLSTESVEHALLQKYNAAQLAMYNHQGTIREGWYVFIDEGKQQPFGYGNLSPYAREQFRDFYQIQARLLANTIDPRSEEAMVPACFQNLDTVEVTSYHVNVGHGNCSVLLIQSGMFYQIWMVDCSIFDKTDHWHNYQTNLDECFKHIARTLNKPESAPITVDRFFLTHAHHDHYSGIEYLVSNHIITDRTICYINLFYQMASKVYIKALKALAKSDVKIIEPISDNSTKAIRFLHPECRLYRSKATITHLVKEKRIVSNPVNDSSTVLLITLGGISMVFTGDLEQKGFENMSGAGTCSSYLFDADYYIVSHHGSINGHPSMRCKNPEIKPNRSPLECAANKLKKAILMGRDGAYSGIYSTKVTSCWGGLPCGLEYSEHAPHFLELKWGSGNVTMI